MQVLLSETAFRRFGDLLPSEHVEWVRHTVEGHLLGEAGERTHDVDPEVAWGTADVLYDGSGPSFFRLVERSEGLKWFQSSVAGLDLPVYPVLLARGCRVTTSHENAVSIAEYVIASVLRTYQMSGRWERAQADLRWQHHEFREVQGTRWLVIGVGAIGSATAIRARAFGASVTGVRRSPTGNEPVDRMVRPGGTLEEVGRSDVVVLALPGGSQTDGLVDDAFLARLKPDAVLVNVARGSLVVDDALTRALERLPEAHAVLDVFRDEPLPADHPFWTHPQVTVTPHVSSGGLGRHRRNAELFARNLASYCVGGPLYGEITGSDLPTGDRSSVPAQFRMDET